MTAPGAIEWIDEELACLDPDDTRARGALEMSRMALEKHEEMLDIESDYNIVSKTAADLSDRFVRVRDIIYDDENLSHCPVCGSFAKRSYYFCHNCGQRLRKDEYKIRK